jgi:hypothetical protein
MHTRGLYIGARVRRQVAGQLVFPSHLGVVRAVVPGWRGKSGRLGAPSRFESSSADRSLLPRDVGGDVVGVTSVLPVVTSGRDVSCGSHLELAGLPPGHYTLKTNGKITRLKNSITF